jgi:hypothetical protein
MPLLAAPHGQRPTPTSADHGRGHDDGVHVELLGRGPRRISTCQPDDDPPQHVRAEPVVLSFRLPDLDHLKFAIDLAREVHQDGGSTPGLWLVVIMLASALAGACASGLFRILGAGAVAAVAAGGTETLGIATVGVAIAALLSYDDQLHERPRAPMIAQGGCPIARAVLGPSGPLMGRGKPPNNEKRRRPTDGVSAGRRRS